MVEEYTTRSSDSARQESVEREIKTIGDRSTWLLGFLTIIVAGLTSFVFQDLNSIIVESNFPSLKPAVLALLTHYLAITLIILLVQMASFVVLYDEYKTEANEARLKRIKLGYRIAMVFAVISLFFVCGFAIYFSYI